MSATTISTVKLTEAPQYMSPVDKYKLVFLGDAGTGKTSIITRFMYGSFDPTYQSTIGIDFLSKTFYYGSRPIRLQLWDTAGQERFRSLIPSYIRDSSVAVLVYDITNRESFLNIRKWSEDVREQREDAMLMLVANKTDLNKSRVVSTFDGEQLAKELKCQFIECSAKDASNVECIFQQIVATLPEETEFSSDSKKCKAIKCVDDV